MKHVAEARERDLVLALLLVESGLLEPGQAMQLVFSANRGNPGLERMVVERGIASPEQLDPLLKRLETIMGDEMPTMAEQARLISLGSLDGDPTKAEDQLAFDDTIGSIGQEQPGRYEIKGVYGSGGQAKVLLAFDSHIGREVALKQLRPEENSGESTSPWLSPRSIPGLVRFLREARVTGQLEHPNIVPVYELGRRQDGSLYYTMRLVRGQTLAQKLKSCKNLSERLQLLGVLWDICKAVAYAHSRGVVHRDIKPSNIMVGEFQEAVLLDWGIAKVSGRRDIGAHRLEKQVRILEEESGDRTSAGSAIGTPAYMSPEQARGEIEKIDERSDVWGLGAVLYEILTGHPPHRGKNRREVMVRAARKKVAPVRQVCPEAPKELAAIAEKALQFEQDARYQSARELADDIGAWMTGEKVGAYTYTSWELVKRFASQHKAAIASAILALVALVGALIAVSVALHEESLARQNEQAALEREKAAHMQERRQFLLANLHLAQAYTERAEAAMKDGEYVKARLFALASLHNNPAHSKSPYHDPEFSRAHPQAWNWRVKAASALYRIALNWTAELAWRHDEKEVLTGLSFQPNGNLGAVGSYDGSVVLFANSDGSVVTRLHGHEGRVYGVAFGPSGKMLASAGHDRKVVVWSVDDASRKFALEGHDDAVRSVAFSPDGKLLASASLDGKVGIWKLTEQGAGKLLPLGHGKLYCARFAPRGRSLAVAAEDGTIVVVDADSARQTASSRISKKPLYAIGFSKSGRMMAVAGDDRNVHLLTFPELKAVHLLKGHRDGILGVALSGDERLAASVGYDNTLRVWDLASGRQLFTLSQDGFLYSVEWAGNLRLAFTGYMRSVQKLKLYEPPRLPVLKGHTGTIYALTASADGRMLASAGWDQTIRLWELPDGKPLKQLKGHGGVIDGLAFSPDGKLIASASRDGTVRLWDLKTGGSKVLVGHRDVVYTVAFSPDGRLLASAGMDGDILLRDARSTELLLRIRAHSTEIDSVAFSPDGKLLASTGHDGSVRIFDATSGTLLKVLEAHRDWASSVAFSPDGRYLVSSGKDARIVVWEAHSGKQLFDLKGHSQWVNSARFSPGGKLLASASDDRTVRIWSVADRRQLLIIPAASEVVAVTFIDGGRKIAVGDAERVVLYPVSFDWLDVDAGGMMNDMEKRLGMRLEGFEVRATAAH